MATNNMVPYSNPGGNNQTTPGSMLAGPTPVSGGPKIPGATMGSGTGAGANPFMPTGAVPGASKGPSPFPSVPMPMQSGAAPGTFGAPAGTPGAGNTPAMSDLHKQFQDILGKGVGGELNNFIEGLGGTESEIFKQFLASMQPQQAKEQADLMQTLGSAGVSPNSTVAALGLSDLQAKNFATESGVNAQLMQHNQDLTSGTLQNMEGLASQEVAQSGWDTFAQVAGAVGNLAGPVMSAMGGGGLSKMFGGGKAPAATNWDMTSIGGTGSVPSLAAFH